MAAYLKKQVSISVVNERSLNQMWVPIVEYLVQQAVAAVSSGGSGGCGGSGGRARVCRLRVRGHPVDLSSLRLGCAGLGLGVTRWT